VCYKPSMRKWMRERMRRRKKPSSTEPKEAPAPLQPAYFEDQAARQEQEPTVEPSEPELAEVAARPQTEETTEAGAAKTAPRRRRRRGGRGRGRRGEQSAAPAQVSEIPAEAGAVAAEEAAGPPAASKAAPPPVPQEPQPVVKRAPKGAVVLAIGLPGSGKSSWFKRHNITPLSSDLLRALLFDDPTEQRFQDLIFSNLRSMLRARLIARRPMNYVDATNLSPHERHSWIKLAKDYGYEVHAMFFDVPLEVCLQRNARRHRVVSEDVMRRMAAKLRPPSFDEGFTRITIVRVKHKD
jgi:predicted kinase